MGRRLRTFRGLDHLELSPQDLEGLADAAWYVVKHLASRDRDRWSTAEVSATV